ncbi:MAG: hypothetical protein IJ788_02835 [Oscillospiraceae bacterium]|nr:hypothetical protein [Oscillospiraceae bacterium]
METINIKSKVYIKTDENGNIIACDGGYTTPTDLTDWIEIDEGKGDRYNLCQTHYFESGLFSAGGVPLYEYKDGEVRPRDETVINTEREAIEAEIVRQSRIAELKALLEETDYIACKLAEGAATREEYADMIAERQAWRNEINSL